MLSYEHGIIFDCGVVSPYHRKYVVGGLNATNKTYLSILLKTVQLLNAATKN